MSKAIIIDLDGTLCNMVHRLSFIVNQAKKKDWNTFYSKIGEDTVNGWCYEIISLFAQQNFNILYVTGRPNNYRSVTMDWLRQNNCPINGLFMREEKDNRKDDIVKKEIYLSFIKPKYEILFCIDDRPNVTQMWRSLGLVCLQCNEDMKLEKVLVLDSSH